MISFLKAHFSLENKVSGLLIIFLPRVFHFSTNKKELLDSSTTTTMHIQNKVYA